MVTRRKIMTSAIAAIAALTVGKAQAEPTIPEFNVRDQSYNTYPVGDPETGRLSENLGSQPDPNWDALVVGYIMNGPAVPPDHLFETDPMPIAEFIDNHYFAGGFVESVRVYWVSSV